MTILEFKSENVKKISVVEFKPSPKGLVIVAGKNAAGKSSVLDTIEMVLAGADHIPSKPVRKGQDKATGELDLGEFTVRRTITSDGGGSLVVRNKLGIKQSSPQAILDGLYGKLSFDPLDFARQNPAKRSETLRALLGLDFTELQARYDTLFAERTVINRTVKAKEAMLANNRRHEGVPEDEQSSDALLKQQQEAIAANNANRKVHIAAMDLGIVAVRTETEVARLVDGINEIDLEIQRLTQRRDGRQAELRLLEVKLKEQLEAHHVAEEQSSKLKDHDLSAFSKQLSELEYLNLQIRANKQVDQIAADLKSARNESDKITKQLDSIDREKRDRISNAKFPVPGLGLGDSNEVIFNGIPFDSASTAEQLKISVAMGLALNPKLKVLLIRQGNDLDDDNLELVAKLADDNGAQIWLERVSTDGNVSLIIEDGHIKDPSLPL